MMAFRAMAATSSLRSSSALVSAGTASLAAGPISRKAMQTGNRTAASGSPSATMSAGTALAAAGPMLAMAYAAWFRV